MNAIAHSAAPAWSEAVATVLYVRLRNVLAACSALPPGAAAQFAAELRAALETPVARQGGAVAQRRPDSILAVFGNHDGEKPDHARRALHAATLAVYETAALNRRIAAWARSPAAPRIAVATGVHLGTVDVAPAAAGTSGDVRVMGEAVEIARLLECTAPDLGWSIVASGAARRAAGARIEARAIGSVALPDSSFIDVAEVTGLAPRVSQSAPRPVYQQLRETIAANARLFERPAGAAGSSAASGATELFSIEGYRILRRVGEGAAASVYLAEPADGGEAQVLKVQRLGSGGDDALQRFIQEFALLAQVRHRNVAAIHRQGFSAGHAYLAMEYFPEGDLRGRLGRPIPAATALRWARDIASGLQAVHAASIVHRDLKPDNLMLRADGTVALADFGIAKHVSMRITDTAHGEVVGTPYYLSPEQASGLPVDRRCDLYSLGVILFEMLAGRKPYLAPSAEELLRLHAEAPVPALPAQHAHLQPILERLMAKDRERRYAGAEDFLAELAWLGC